MGLFFSRRPRLVWGLVDGRSPGGLCFGELPSLRLDAGRLELK